MSVIDFPDNPEVGDLYTVGDLSWEWSGDFWRRAGARAQSIITSESAPESPYTGLLWFNSTNARLFVYYDNFWVEITGTTIVDNTVVQELSALPQILSLTDS